MTVAALICARGGSKRIYRKNVQLAGGKKLIEWPLIAANESRIVTDIFVSTDDAEIADVGHDYGAIVLKRPWQFATDSASNGSMVLHALREVYRICEADYVVMMYPTSPMIEARHIDEAYYMLRSKGDAADSITTIHKLNKTSMLNNLFTLNPDSFMFNFWGIHGQPAYLNNDLFPVYYQNGAMGIIKIGAELFDGMLEIYDDTDAHMIDLQYAAVYAKREARNMANNQIKLLGYIVDESVAWDINYPSDLIVADALLSYREHMKDVCGINEKE
jgi:CMP-N,N'-diacetyllegionaminic acid synthase